MGRPPQPLAPACLARTVRSTAQRPSASQRALPAPAPDIAVRHSAPPAGPRLQRHHFAFMRAINGGVSEDIAWKHYLDLEGRYDPRSARRTVRWIRDELAAAARRAGRKTTARYFLIDLRNVKDKPAAPLPSLDEFAAEIGAQ